MATCSVSLKFSEKPGRFRVEGVHLTKNVDHLKKLVAEKISVVDSQFDLIYCGRCMSDEKTVESYGVKPGVTLHALRKKETESGFQAEPMDEAAVQQLLTALQSALINPAQRHQVVRILTSRDMLDNVIDATPCLQSDPSALAMLQDPELLIQLADPNMIHKIVKAHPSLGQAALQLAAAVNEESSTSRGPGSFLAGFPEEDMEISESAPGTSQASSRQQQQPITSAQLAAALASAGVDATLGSSPGATSRSANQSQSSTSSGGASGGGSQSSITADLFSQAMAQALSDSATSAASTSSSSPSRPELQSQLQQLREMGITDEGRCLRALQATEGNVQAALDLLFDGTI